MQFHAPTLLAMTTVNLLTVSLALPLLMGRGVSKAARFSQGSLMAQMLAWVFLVASDYWFDHAFSVVSMVFMSLTQGLLFNALSGWLGRRPGGRCLQVLMVLMPLGYGLGFDSYAFRVGWANYLLAAQMLIVARATLYPHRLAGRRWRWLLLICMVMMAVFTAARGTLGAFYTASYPSFGALHPVNLAALLATNITMVVCTLSAMVAWREEVEMRLSNLAMVDVLTSLLNRRGFTARAEAMLAQARRYPVPMVAMMLDIDFFKQINDTHGHEVGDRALQLFARLLSENQRAGGVVGRLGGEEFCVLLPHADVTAALVVDGRLREKLRGTSMAELGFSMDYSAGMAVLTPEDTALALLLARADKALYQAKAQGRGRLLQG